MPGETKPTVREQEINPWDVQGGLDENGEVASIDYDAICRCLDTLALRRLREEIAIATAY